MPQGDSIGTAESDMDHTVRISNLAQEDVDAVFSPQEPAPNRRTVLGNRVQERYHGALSSHVSFQPTLSPPRVESSISKPQAVEDNSWNESSYANQHRSGKVGTPSNDHLDPNQTYQDDCDTQNIPRLTSPLHTNGYRIRPNYDAMSPITPHDKSPSRKRILELPPISSMDSGTERVHETIHAQSLLLGVLFMLIWSPSNLLAPNLTQVAHFFGMSASERDLYLGSYLALAQGVLSFPISASIGILADNHSRKILFICTGIGGGISCLLTGLAPNYTCLFVARFFNGGFMSASVPVAFSLLSDLFATEERNAASSGLTAMMGCGIIMGQVYAGCVGDSFGWQHSFFRSSMLTVSFAFLLCFLVREPVRGGKEKVLQKMIKQGTPYERKLTWNGFLDAMQNNNSNKIIMWQGFFSSLPWGVIFVFLNDYLSQERGFSVQDATYIVFLFGLGCAGGGVLGGYWGAIFQRWNRSYLPLFMGATTILGILPFLGLLNGTTTNVHGWWAMSYSILGGLVASLPSVNVRPCLINVNPPETRGASLTAANLIIQLARGFGPSCVTLMVSIFNVQRRFAFNFTIIVFWIISGIQLFFLAKTLPIDQDTMDHGLEEYAKQAALEKKRNRRRPDDVSIVSIEERMVSFDGTAARESLTFVRKGIREMQLNQCQCVSEIASEVSSEGDMNSTEDDILSSDDMMFKRELWQRKQELQRYNAQNGDENGSIRQPNTNETNFNPTDDQPLSEVTPLLTV